MGRKVKLLSVVIPAYNEELNIQNIYIQLQESLSGIPFEIIFVNDGSADSTKEEVQKIAKKDPSVRLVQFSRNFGKEAATSAGIAQAKGDATIMVDADGQFPVELIPDFIKLWQDGADIVTGIRVSNQNEGVVKKTGSKFFYKIMNGLGGVKITPQATDFRLIDKKVQKEFIRFSERTRMTRGLIDWLGFNEVFIEFKAKPRMAGEASYKVSKLVRLALNSFVSLSKVPLYISGYAGIFITLTSFLLGLFIVVEELILGDPMNLNVTGTAMLAILLLFFMGIVLISQGLLALYISHIHTETQNRPLYVIDSTESIDLNI